LGLGDARIRAGRIYFEQHRSPVAALIALRPDWASAKDDDAEAEKGKACVVKVVMTGSADDGPDWQPHIRSKDKRRKLANEGYSMIYQKKI
jgi:hypothetical protein